MRKDSLVSIIIPVFNTEKFLARCLDSVVCQTYKNLEIIIIDDGSTDNSARIYRDYAQQDSRISIVVKENGGPSIAVTQGVEIAKGEYISFVDSDDFISEIMIENMLDVAYQYNADIVQCNYSRVYDETNVPYYCFNQLKVFEESDCILATIQMLNYFEYMRPQNHQYFSHARWGKLIRTQLIRSNLEYMDYRIQMGEDLHRLIPIFIDSKKIVAIPEIYYYYVQHGKGMTKVWSKTRPNDNKLLIENANKIAKIKGVHNELRLAIAKKEYDMGLDLIERTCAKNIPLANDDKVELMKSTYKAIKYVKIKYCTFHAQNKRRLMRILLKLRLYRLIMKIFN